MARPAFKRWWTRFVPPPVERSTYVLVSSLLLGLLFWQWRPIPAVVWHVEHPAGRWLLHAVFWAGWAIVLVSTFLIDHFDLFGLRQVYLYASGREYTPPAFRTPGLYRYVRHPLMTGLPARLLGDADDDRSGISCSPSRRPRTSSSPCNSKSGIWSASTASSTGPIGSRPACCSRSRGPRNSLENDRILLANSAHPPFWPELRQAAPP